MVFFHRFSRTLRTHKNANRAYHTILRYVSFPSILTQTPLNSTYHEFLQIAIVLAIVFGVIMYRVAMTTIIRLTGSERLEIHGPFMLQASSACLQVVSIQLFGLFYVRLSKWLTNLENPRTQTEYDSLIAQKRYLLCFWNNYASLFYIAFVKVLKYKTPC